MKRSLFAVSLIALVLLAVVFPVAAADRKVTIAMMTGPELEFLRELPRTSLPKRHCCGVHTARREAYITGNDAADGSKQHSGHRRHHHVSGIAQFAAGGYLEPLGVDREVRPVARPHDRRAADTVRYDGELYGVPTDGATMFVYRKDWQDPPDTWDEFIEEGKKRT